MAHALEDIAQCPIGQPRVASSTIPSFPHRSQVIRKIRRRWSPYVPPWLETPPEEAVAPRARRAATRKLRPGAACGVTSLDDARDNGLDRGVGHEPERFASRQGDADAIRSIERLELPQPNPAAAHGRSCRTALRCPRVEDPEAAVVIGFGETETRTQRNAVRSHTVLRAGVHFIVLRQFLP